LVSSINNSKPSGAIARKGSAPFGSIAYGGHFVPMPKARALAFVRSALTARTRVRVRRTYAAGVPTVRDIGRSPTSRSTL